jgi:hypothetical protein
MYDAVHALRAYTNLEHREYPEIRFSDMGASFP